MASLGRSVVFRDRFFPEVQSLYIVFAPSSLAGLADTPMGWQQRYVGLRLTPADRLARMLYLHRAAVLAEQAGEWNTADFYFREFLGQLKSAPPDCEVWPCPRPAVHDFRGQNRCLHRSLPQLHYGSRN